MTQVTSVDHMPLSPLAFLERSARVWRDRPAVVDGSSTVSYGQFHEKVGRASAVLARHLGVGAGDRVAALLPNVAELLELHFAVPGSGAVLVPLNTRLASAEYAYILEHSGAVAVVAWSGLRNILEPALQQLASQAPRVVWVDGGYQGEWADLCASADPSSLALPTDERDLLSINYTSGTTGPPKGVMTTHRGAYLHTLGVIAEAQLSPRSAYLWTLPMFHCNGWAYTWAVTAAGAAHRCLERVDPHEIWGILGQSGITHMCGAPTVVSMLVGAPEANRVETPVQLFVGGAPPAPALLERAAALNIQITHLYGLTETYGPIAVCAWNPEWDGLGPEDQARLRARQGVGTVVSERLRVVDPQGRDVPADGASVGEIVMRGNNVMAGYYRDVAATMEAFRGGWFHSGDLAVMHPDGYVEVRDRLKDVVISGGENIASVEVEQALVAHPSIAEAAVVGAPDEKWGEVPVAFVTRRGAARIDEDEVRQFVAGRLARFKVPKRIVVVDDLPKTGTGKVQKFALRDRAGAG